VKRCINIAADQDCMAIDRNLRTSDFGPTADITIIFQLNLFSSNAWEPGNLCPDDDLAPFQRRP